MMVKTNEIDDENVRAEVINDPSSFILSAPAGSGKTTLLAKRIVKRLLEVNDPNEIIALTFTKKAANEMSNKVKAVLKRTEKTFDGPFIQEQLNKHSKKNNWDDNYIGNLKIMTLDSLAFQILRKEPLLSDYPKVEELTETLNDLYEIAINEVIKEPQNYQDVEKVLLYLNENHQTIVNEFVEMLKKRDQWLPPLIELSKFNDSQIEEFYISSYHKEMGKRIDEINKLFTALEIEELRAIYIELKSKKNPELQQQFDPKNTESWKDLLSLIYTKEHTIRAKFKDKMLEKISKIFNKNINKISILKDFNNVLNEDNIKDIFPIMPSLFRLLTLMYAELKIALKGKNQIDFTEVQLTAIAVLKERPIEVVLGHDVSHIFVDEYQDTNDTQEAFLKLITNNFHYDPSKSLFIVGDSMQSIYRFRKAEVKHFINAKRDGIGGLKLKNRELNKNFRSCEKIINWCNDYMPMIFPQENSDKGAAPYLPFTYGGEEVGDGTSIHYLQTNAFTKKSLFRAEAKFVVEKIESLRKEKPGLEIAMLTRTRQTIREILSEMRRKKIPFKAIGIDQVKDQQIYQDIMSLTKALYNLDDKVHWIAILRAPWCGLDLRSLSILFEYNHNKDAWEVINDTNITNKLDEDNKKRLYFLRNVITRTIGYRGRVSHRFFIESVWRMLMGDKCLRDNDDLDHIDTFLDLVDECSNSLSINFNKLDKITDEIHITNNTTGKNPVKISTIHAAKGLEYDCVILPNLNRRVKPDDKPLILLDGDNLISIKNNNEKTENLFNYNWKKERIRIENEQIRLLYVAITRAKKECHLIFSINEKKIEEDDEEITIKEDRITKIENDPNIEGNSLLKILWPIVRDKEIIKIKAEKPLKIDANIPKLRRLKIEHYSQEIEAHPPSPKHEIKKNHQNNIHTFTGILIHKYYKLIIKNQEDINKILSNKLDFIMAYFNDYGFKLNEIKEAKKVITSSLSSLLNSKDGKWIYQLYQDDIMEAEYLFDEENIFEKRIPDRTFIHDNKRWIVDYKVVFNDKNLIPEAKKHTTQLKKYEALFDDKYQIQKAIYFTAQGYLVLL
ncbi:MAG: UvrD-helicase domain-containing protein [Methylophilaceae bacterium]|nr:UvrD-helicase domain-containing protein [Methylophilaceae bacterium]